MSSSLCLIARLHLKKKKKEPKLGSISPVIPARDRLRQEDRYEFEASLRYSVHSRLASVTNEILSQREEEEEEREGKRKQRRRERREGKRRRKRTKREGEGRGGEEAYKS